MDVDVDVRLHSCTQKEVNKKFESNKNKNENWRQRLTFSTFQRGGT